MGADSHPSVSQSGPLMSRVAASVAEAQLTSRRASRRLQYGLIGDPSGRWISTWAWGTDPSEFPLSPIQPMT